LAALVALAESDSPRAWLAATLAVVLGVCVRYAGILGLVVLLLWFLYREKWPWYRGAAAVKLAILSGGAIACLGLMAWNIATRGYASGAPRPGGAGLAELGTTISELGWGALAAFTTTGIRNAFGRPTLEHVIGWATVAAMVLLVVRAWWRPVSAYSRPFALGLAVYLAGMTALATTRSFDPLSSARTFIPALPLFFVLAIEPWRKRPTQVLFAGLLFISGPGLIMAGRGVSRQIAPDFRPALAAITPGLRANDSLGVNLMAVGLSAWLDQRVTRIDDSLDPLTTHRWLVLAADLTQGRDPIPVWSSSATNLRAELAAGSQFELVFQNAGLNVWRRREPSPSP
jgi:hypothetical protein